MKLNSETETLDTFYHGRIKVIQSKKGYRFSIDAPLLADFIKLNPNDQCLELGAGNGIVSLLLSIKSFKHITAWEVQKKLYDLASRNIELNGLEEKITIIYGDLRTLKSEINFDVIFSNPPYIAKNSGNLSPNDEISIAKHEIMCSISDIMLRTSLLLKKEGRAYFIFPEKRRNEFMEEAEKSKLQISSLRKVYSHAGIPPRFFLCELRKREGENDKIMPFFNHPSLILYTKKHAWTKEAKSIFSGRIKKDNS